jgi:hypothetical protein
MDLDGFHRCKVHGRADLAHQGLDLTQQMLMLCPRQTAAKYSSGFGTDEMLFLRVRLCSKALQEYGDQHYWVAGRAKEQDDRNVDDWPCAPEGTRLGIANGCSRPRRHFLPVRFRFDDR